MSQCKYERTRVFHCTRKVATATLSAVGKSELRWACCGLVCFTLYFNCMDNKTYQDYYNKLKNLNQNYADSLKSITLVVKNADFLIKNQK